MFLIYGNEEMISSAPSGLLNGIYLFYKIRSTETSANSFVDIARYFIIEKKKGPCNK